MLGLGFSAVGLFFRNHQLLFARIGGVLVILFGLYQLGLFGEIGFLSSEKKLTLSGAKIGSAPLAALIMGFVFSFSWTPCVGPVLSGVLLMATSASNRAAGFGLIGIYTLGFVLPFLACGLFTGTILGFFRKHRNVVKYTTRIGGVLLILMGILMLSGTMNAITGYLSKISGSAETESSAVAESSTPAEDSMPDESEKFADKSTEETSAVLDEGSSETEAESSVESSAVAESSMESSVAAEESSEASEEVFPAPDFELTDQYGQTHRLSDYRGKVVFLNFWATWCPPCRAEMPDIQKLYEEFQKEGREDVVFLSVAYPNLGSEQDIAGITAFLEDNGYTYPALMDEAGVTINDYYISAFPTTFMIGADGNIFGYVTGSISEDFMRKIIGQTLENKR